MLGLLTEAAGDLDLALLVAVPHLHAAVAAARREDPTRGLRLPTECNRVNGERALGAPASRALAVALEGVAFLAVWGY